MKPKMLFNEQALPFILEIFGKSINDNGFIIDKNTGECIKASDNTLLTKENFGGVKKGKNGLPVFLIH